MRNMKFSKHIQTKTAPGVAIIEGSLSMPSCDLTEKVVVLADQSYNSLANMIESGSLT